MNKGGMRDPLLGVLVCTLLVSFWWIWLTQELEKTSTTPRVSPLSLRKPLDSPLVLRLDYPPGVHGCSRGFYVEKE
jgi:hypothetical protein